jgi:demethylmenaquinone methyltransferase/2-methoxy-6-polyprenyl-1,4-benzoquinol methylase
MFNRIAARYDLLNHLLSAGSDLYWRRAALDVLDIPPGSRILDVCTGTGDLALGALRRRPKLVAGVDLALGMMRLGREKTARPSRRTVHFVCGNAEALPFRPRSFDRAMVAFGVRNFADIPAGLKSIYRVLRPPGRLVVLELSRPRLPVMRHVYALYFRYLLPRIGGLISGDADAYRYLHASVMGFPERERFLALMADAGFLRTGCRDLSLGIATLYWGEKDVCQT